MGKGLAYVCRMDRKKISVCRRGEGRRENAKRIWEGRKVFQLESGLVGPKIRNALVPLWCTDHPQVLTSKAKSTYFFLILSHLHFARWNRDVNLRLYNDQIARDRLSHGGRVPSSMYIT